MEADGLEEGEINAPGGLKVAVHAFKNTNDWEDNKENTNNYVLFGEPLKRRKLRDSSGERNSPMDTYIPPYSNLPKIDSYFPEYKSRMEWMQMLKERERKQRTIMKNRVITQSEERISYDLTPKSGSETISDEHSSSFSGSLVVSSSIRGSLLDETSQDQIIWPSWLDPAGSFSANITPLPEFQPFIQEKKILKQKKQEELKAQLGDNQLHIDVSTLKNSKGVLSGDGWMRQKDGTRLPNIFWKFIQNALPPIDPRTSIQQLSQ